jgi:hypothetical protein
MNIKSKTYGIVFGYSITNITLTSTLEKEDKYTFEIKKFLFRLEQFNKGFYLHRIAKPTKKGIKATFKKINNNAQLEAEKISISRDLKKLAATGDDIYDKICE